MRLKLFKLDKDFHRLISMARSRSFPRSRTCQDFRILNKFWRFQMVSRLTKTASIWSSIPKKSSSHKSTWPRKQTWQINSWSAQLKSPNRWNLTESQPSLRFQWSRMQYWTESTTSQSTAILHPLRPPSRLFNWSTPAAWKLRKWWSSALTTEEKVKLRRWLMKPTTSSKRSKKKKDSS